MNRLERALRGVEVGPDEVRSALSRLTNRAARDGLIDVAVGQADSPFGRLLVAVTARGLVRLAYPDEEEASVLEELTAISPRVLRSPGKTERVRRQLDRYFQGRLQRFEVQIDWGLTRGFGRRVLQNTARIPFGSVSTYRDVAGRSGSPRAYRAAGNALSSNPIPIVVPCHRVVASSGGLGGYTGGLDRKAFLLELEGVTWR